jgi:hypothetical protein
LYAQYYCAFYSAYTVVLFDGVLLYCITCTQTPQVRRLRTQLKSGAITQQEYEHGVDMHIAYAIGLQVQLATLAMYLHHTLLPLLIAAAHFYCIVTAVFNATTAESINFYHYHITHIAYTLLQLTYLLHADM